MAKHDPNTVLTARCNEIDADVKWNARREIQEQSQETGEPNTGYLDIVYSIASKGQTTPVVLRPHPKAGETVRGKKVPAFFLCSGFQRYRAINEIAAGVHDDYLGSRGILVSALAAMKSDKPMIRAFVRDLTDEQARDENVAENTIRCSLSAPDIAFGMADMFKINKNLNIDALALRWGISPSYAGVLKTTYDGLACVNVPADHPVNPDKKKDMTLAEVWRQESVKPKKDDIKHVATLQTGKGENATDATAEEKLAEYAKIRGPKATTEPKRGPGAWVKNAIDTHAKTIGTMLGNLARDGAIELVGIEARHVKTMLEPLQALPSEDKWEKTRKENAKANLPDYDTALDSIAVAIKKAFNAGLAPAPIAKPKDATEAAATTDGIPSPPDGKSKRKSGNGRAAEAS